MENQQQDHLSQMDIQIDNGARHQLNEAAKWGKFLSLVIFIGCALMLLFGIIGGSALVKTFGAITPAAVSWGEYGALFIGIIVFVVAIISFVYYFLYQFSVKVKSALMSENPDQFNAAIKSLKTFFIITTIAGGLSLLSSLAKIF